MNSYTTISLRIVVLFITAIGMSFLGDYLHNFFGDELCNGFINNAATGEVEDFYHYGTRHHDTVYHWGYRHWLYFTMGLSLTIIQIIVIISEVNKETDSK